MRLKHQGEQFHHEKHSPHTTTETNAATETVPQQQLSESQ
jgi:hypothetical protein